jgi:hypothetical protein
MVKPRRLPALVIALLLLSSAPLIAQRAFSTARELEASKRDVTLSSATLLDVLNSVRVENVVEHAKYLSSLGSRVTGYPGSYRAAEYIADYLSKLGLKVVVQTYSTVVPYDYGSSVYLPSLNVTLKAYALWPRGGIQEQVVAGLRGRLYYVGRGEWEDLNGKDLAGAILLMDFNSGKNWLRAVSLGAKAVIFIEPDTTDKYEALAKGTVAPLNVPLLYVDRGAGELLKKAASRREEAVLYSNLRWRVVNATNVIGVLEGESPHDVVLISAHYDSWSIVPALSPAAEDAVSPAVLLELARVLSQRKSELRRSVWFVAYSGHWEGLAGPAEFVEEFFFRRNATERFWLQMGIDLSSETPFVDLLAFNAIPTISPNILAYFSSVIARFAWAQRIAGEILSSIRLRDVGIALLGENSTLNDLVNVAFSGYYWGSQPDLFFTLDTAPHMQTSGVAFTVRTQYARRLRWLTPLNDFGYIRWENVRPQILVVTALAYAFATYSDFGVSYEGIAPKRIAIVAQAMMGYATLWGRTVEFSYEKGWYKALPNAVVRLILTTYPITDYCWPFLYRYTVSDENGTFVFHGLAPFMTWSVDAWRFDEQGNVEYALDFGYMGTAQGISGGISNTVYVLTTVANVLVPLFKCASATFFNVFDADSLIRGLVPDGRSPTHVFYATGIRVIVLDAMTRAPPISYSYVVDPSNGLLVVYGKRGTSILVMAYVGPYSWPNVVLVNATRENPDGTGIPLSRHVIVYNTDLEIAKNLKVMVESRYSKFKEYYVSAPYVDYAINASDRYYRLALSSLEKGEWAYYYGNVTLARNLLYKAYSYSLMPLYNEASTSVLLLSLLIIPFAILLERVLVRASSWKRIVSILLLAFALFAIFGLAHPAFSVMSNSVMGAFGTALAFMVAFAALLLSRRAEELVRAYKIAKLGIHEYRTEAAAAFLYVVETAADNIRGRPLRSALAFLTVVSVALGLVALTSTTYAYTHIASVQQGVNPLYEGVLVKSMYGFPPASVGGGILDNPLLELLSAAYGREYVVAPRVWCYPMYRHPEGDNIKLSKAGDLSRVVVLTPAAFMGVTEEELRIALSKYNLTLLLEFNESSIVIGEDAARALGVKPGDRVYVWGYQEFVVAGTVALREVIYDNNGYPWLPIDPGFSGDLTLSGFTYSSGMSPTSVTPSNAVFVHWKTALKYGGFISSIALIPRGAADRGRAVADQIADILPLGGAGGVSYASREAVYSVRQAFTVFFTGGMYAVVNVIAILSILNFMMGAVHERRREIMTYQALGLSPRGAVVLFLTESAVVALGGALTGYLAGLALNRLLLSLQVLPPTFSFNFVSMAIFISLLAVIGSALAASLYPAYLASRMVTPSYERKWKPPTKPQDSTWYVPLPLRVRAEEALPVLRYLNEFFGEEGFVGPGYKVVELRGVDAQRKVLSMRILLTPEETGVLQDVDIFFECPSERECTLAVLLKYVSGDKTYFAPRNLKFLDAVRKQSLMWASLPGREKARYFAS